MDIKVSPGMAAAPANGVACAEMHGEQGALVAGPEENVAPVYRRDSIYFPVTVAAQKEIFNSYVQRIQRVQSGEQDIFFPSLLDMESVKNYRHLEDPYNVAVLDVGGTVLKAAVLCVSADPETKRPQFTVLSSYNIPYEPLHEGEDAALAAHHWNDWVARALAEKTGLAREDVRCASLTFSYPLVQKSLCNAVIKAVAKNWMFAKHDGLLTENIVDVFNASLAAHGFMFEVKCVLNDAIATYMAGLADDPCSTQAAFVLGTGVNGAFELGIGGRLELLNNEVARFAVPDALISTADRTILEDLRQNDVPYQELEVLIAGYKFVDIIRAQLRHSGSADARAERLALGDIIDILDPRSTRHRDAFEQAVGEMATAYKLRAGKVLAAILLAISLAVDTSEMRVIMNGTICQHSLDEAIIREELRIFADMMARTINYKLVSIPNASLIGAALAAAVTLSAGN